MQEMEQLDILLSNLKQTEQDIKEWQDLRSTPAWSRLTAFLRFRYAEIGSQDCDSLAKLKARNAVMQLIRDIFAFTFGTLNEKEILLHELDQLTPLDE